MCSLLGNLLIDMNPVCLQVHATAAMCNLVLELSGVRDAVLGGNVLQQLGPLTSSMIPEVRLNAIWALKNLTADCEDSVRLALLQELPWSQMQALLRDCEPGVQDQAVALLQNLCKASGSGLEQVLGWSEGELLVLLEEMLDPSSGLYQQQPGRLLAKVLFTVANVCSGLEAQKELVMCSNIPALLLHHLKEGGEGAGRGVAGGGRAGREAGDAGEAKGGPSSSSGVAEGVSNSSGVGSGERGGQQQQQQQECVPEGGVGAWAARYRAFISRGGAGSVPCSTQSGGRGWLALGGGLQGCDQRDSDVSDPCEVRLAAVWCVINLLWCEEGGVSEGVVKRAAALRDLGVDEVLRGLQSAPSQDVRERVCTALEQLAVKP